MMKKNLFRVKNALLCVCLISTAFAGCGKGTDASLAGSVMKNYAKKMICAFLTALMVITVMPASAYAADGISYVRRSWNSSTKMVEKVTDTCTNYTHLWDYSEDDDHTLYSGWYIADNGLSFDELEVAGTVNIIVPDGNYLYCDEGIIVNPGNTLNIYGQANDSGILDIFNSDNYCAGIGGSDETNCGTINIYGGTVKAEADYEAAGIGSGDEAEGTNGTISIYGGTVTATGASWGAGIGGGDEVSGGTVRIYGGNVTANGGKRAAGIGGGNKANGGTVEIYGGDVTANGGGWGAGIGGGNNGNSGNITINGGKVTATGGDGGAALGDGDGDVYCSGNITINGGDITAKGGDEAAGIGGGNQGGQYAGNITINDGTIDATGGQYAAGIGGGDQEPSGMIDIYGGNITATGGKYASGIGGGDEAGAERIRIYGGTIDADGSTGIGSGANGKIGTILIFGGEIDAQGSTYGAGIGGSWKSIGGSITIRNGKILSKGGYGGAGIGCGWKSDDTEHVTITISDGDVEAYGGHGSYSLAQYSDSLALAGPGIGGILFEGDIILSGGNIKSWGSFSYCEEYPEYPSYYDYSDSVGIGSTVLMQKGSITVGDNANIETGTYSTRLHYRTPNLVFNDNTRVKTKNGDTIKYIDKNDRESICKSTKAGRIYVEHCDHGSNNYSVINADSHNSVCSYCGHQATEAHEMVVSSWSWSDDSISATVRLTCKDCGYITDVVATVAEPVYDDHGAAQYVATAQYKGKSYSDERFVKDGVVIDEGVTITWRNSDGTFLDTEYYKKGAEISFKGDTPECPKEGGTFAGWDDGNHSYVLPAQSIPAASENLTYTAFYKFDAAEKRTDEDGEYFTGRVAHFEITSESGYLGTLYFEVKEDGTKGAWIPNYKEDSDYEFELLDDGTYRISKYIGSTDNLSEITVPKSYKGKRITVIGKENEKFINTNNEFKLVLNENITTIAEGAFEDVPLTEISGDTSSLSLIGDRAFQYNSGYHSLILKLDYTDNITIGDYALKNRDVVENIMHETKLVDNSGHSGHVGTPHSVSYTVRGSHIANVNISWGSDLSEATAHVECQNSHCGYKEDIPCEITSKDKEDKIIYTATAVVTNNTYTSTQVITKEGITVNKSENGMVEADKKFALSGETVTLNVTPADGYALKSISVTAQDETEITLSGEGNTRTFTMPGKNVTVNAEFERIAANGYSLTLDDGIKVNFLIDTKFYGAEDGYIEYEYIKSSATESAEREGGSINVADLPVYSGTDAYDGNSKLTIKAAPAQIAENYIIRIYNKNSELQKELTVSIADYCEKLKGDATYGELMSALLNYGQLANEYFGYAAKVEGDYVVPHSENYKAALSADESAALNTLAVANIVNQGAAQVTGVSYIAQMNPEFKFIFTGTDATEAEVSGGLSTVVEKSNGNTTVKVTGLNASDFDKTFTVTIDGTVLEYNGYAYLKAAMNSAALSDLARGIFRYAQAADKTFN